MNVSEIKNETLTQTEKNLQSIGCVKCIVCDLWVSQEFTDNNVCDLCIKK